MAVFRVPKTKDYTVMSNHHLRNTEISLKAKGILSLMLSLPDSWDYSLAGLTTRCADGLSSIRAAIAELEAHGYLRRQRIRNDRGQLTEIEYTILEHPENHETEHVVIEQAENPETTPFSPICDFPTLDNPTLGKPTLDKPILEKPTLENRTQLSTQVTNTNLLNTQELNTHQSIYPVSKRTIAHARDRPDGMDAMESYRKIIQDNIEYDFLLKRYGDERINETVEIMLEAVCSKREYIRVAGDEFPKEAVKSRLLKLDSAHIEYAFDCIDKNTNKVRNIKSYLLTTLYNAPVTMDSYYRAEVNHDLYGTKN